MNSLVSTSLLLSVLLLSSLFSAHAAPTEVILPEPSAQPEIDPMTPSEPNKPKLYLVSAGRAPYAIAPLPLDSHMRYPICPGHFPQGFSIRCKANTRHSVIFRVDGHEFRREYRRPFLLNGDKHGRVFEFTGLRVDRPVRVACHAGAGKEVWVDLFYDC